VLIATVIIVALIFGARDKFNELAARRRIKNPCEYLATLQEKES